MIAGNKGGNDTEDIIDFVAQFDARPMPSLLKRYRPIPGPGVRPGYPLKHISEF